MTRQEIEAKCAAFAADNSLTFSVIPLDATPADPAPDHDFDLLDFTCEVGGLPYQSSIQLIALLKDETILGEWLSFVKHSLAHIHKQEN